MLAQRIRAACAAALLIAMPVYAADIYPTKPIRMVVGLPAGSSLDVCARAVSGKLAEPLQQNVVVDNRAGAAGNIAAEIVARARPDGYTLLMGAFGALAVNPNLYRICDLVDGGAANEGGQAQRNCGKHRQALSAGTGAAHDG